MIRPIEAPLWLQEHIAAPHRALTSAAGIRAAIDATRMEIAARSKGDEAHIALRSRLTGLLICRRLLTSPEKCSRPPVSFERVP